MKMLRSKLLELKIEENMKKLAEIRGDIKENAWGRKDLRPEGRADEDRMGQPDPFLCIYAL